MIYNILYMLYLIHIFNTDNFNKLITNNEEL